MKLDYDNLSLDELKQIRDTVSNVITKRLTDAADKIDIRIGEALAGNGTFTDDELRYAATHRCICKAGMAYPKDIAVNGSWYCSDILTGRAPHHTEHSSQMPFMYYEVMSERDGETTRPLHTMKQADAP
jgi:hypothetical protein